MSDLSDMSIATVPKLIFFQVFGLSGISMLRRFEGLKLIRQNLIYFWIRWKFGPHLQDFGKKIFSKSKNLFTAYAKNTKTDANLLMLVLKVRLWVIKQEKQNSCGHIC
jgi:hypothetical protein